MEELREVGPDQRSGTESVSWEAIPAVDLKSFHFSPVCHEVEYSLSRVLALCLDVWGQPAMTKTLSQNKEFLS